MHSLSSVPLLPVPSHPLPSPLIPYPTLSPTLPYLSRLSRPYPTILSLLLVFPHIPSPTYLRSHPYPTLAFPTLRSPRIPYPALPYHIHPDQSRGQNVSFATSLGYLYPSLLYPPLPYQHPYPTHPSTSYLSTPLPSHPIHSTHLPCPNTLSYCTSPLPPTLSSHPLSSSTSPPISSSLPCSTQRFRKNGQDVMVPECIGAEIVWCKTSFGGLK